MTLFNPYWARRRVAALDAERDFQEINHLAFEVRYATPIFTHALFSVAFARQAAVPSIAEVLYRNGKGAIITNTRKRNNDTLLFFGEFYKHGNSPRGQQIAEQLNRIHSHFPITNEQNLYTLATLMCELTRMSMFLTGSNIFSPKETRAIFLFWKMMAGLLHIEHIPADEHAVFDFYRQYETTHFAYSRAGSEIVQALANEFAERWYPAALKSMGRAVYFSLFDDALLQAFRLPAPPKLYRFLVRLYLRAYLSLWVRLMPDPNDRSIIDTFNKDYTAYSIEKVGPQV